MLKELGRWAALPRWLRVTAAVLASVALVAGALRALAIGPFATDDTASGSGDTVATSVTGAVTVVAAGDVACRPPVRLDRNPCSQGRTAGLVERLDPEAVLMLGDAQYQNGSVEEFHAPDAYVATWGRPEVLSRTIPVAGDHDWRTRGAAGYRSVFDGITGGQFYHSRDLSNGWHVVALDSNCDQVGGCTADSPQGQWLQQDLDANDGKPTIAIWHHPRWSSGVNGDEEGVDLLWRAVVADPDVQIVLNAHEHNYERMRPVDVDGTPSGAGAAMFVVGTGGVALRQAPSDARDERSVLFGASAHGVLELTLRPDGFDWRFRVARGRLSDSGSSNLRPRT